MSCYEDCPHYQFLLKSNLELASDMARISKDRDEIKAELERVVAAMTDMAERLERMAEEGMSGDRG